MSEKKINYIVYDIETGGFNSNEHAITEIAMIALDGETLEEVGRYESLVRPYGGLGYTQTALDVTGINMDMLNSGKDSKTVVNEMVSFIKAQGTTMNKKPILCGHNIKKFDNPFISEFFKFHKKDLYKIISPEIMDTMWWSRMRTPVSEDEFGKHNLGDACSREGIEVVDAHRAMSDTAANKEIVVNYLKNLRGSGVSLEKKDDHDYREDFKF
jgi:DNA polymerase III alpha subunit (gram-positive type)